MKRKSIIKRLLSFAASAALGMLAAGCTDSGNTPVQTGHLKLHMTDASVAGIEQVNITFSTVEVHLDGNWIAISGAPVTVNLLEWNNGRTLVIGEKDLAPGRYTQIRLMVSKAEIVVDGVTKPLTIPSGDETGLKLIHNFDITAGTTSEIVLDFDVSKSITRTGNGEYKLKPTIRAIEKPLTGAITGTVTNPAEGLYATAVDATPADVTTTIPDASNGKFTLAFLLPGTYAVRVADGAGRTATKTGVIVTAGQSTDIGTLTLQ
jgi:hypothetical protein